MAILNTSFHITDQLFDYLNISNHTLNSTLNNTVNNILYFTNNISNISNSSNHSNTNNDSDIYAYMAIIFFMVGLLCMPILCGICKLFSTNCNIKKCWREYNSDLRIYFNCDCNCYCGHCFKKIKEKFLCIKNTCVDYWCPLQQDSDIYSNLHILQDTNYLQMYIESLKQKQSNEKKIIKFEEKSIVKSDSEEICSICLEIIDNNKLVATACNHYFCQECIQEYLNDDNDNCPNCRQTIGNTLYKDLPV